MKRILLFSFAFALIYSVEAQVFPMANTNDLEVIDIGNGTKEPRSLAKLEGLSD